MAVTLREIAAEAGVSMMTVSRVLNGKNSGQVSETRAEKIRKIAARLGYASRDAESKLAKLTAAPEITDDPGKVYCLIPYQRFMEQSSAESQEGRVMTLMLLDAAMEMGISLEFLPATIDNDPSQPRWDLLRRIGPGSRIITNSYWYATTLLELNRKGARIAMLSSQNFWRELYRENSRTWSCFTCRSCDAFAASVLELLESGKRKIATIAYRKYMDEPDYPRTTGYLRALEAVGNPFRCVIPLELNHESSARKIQEAYEKYHFDALLAEGNPPSEPDLPPEVTVVRPGSLTQNPQPIPGDWRIIYPHHEIIRDALAALTSEHFVAGERFYDGKIVKD